MDKDFNVGDVVRLKSGGPKMTITQHPYKYGHFVYNDKATCEWFDGTNFLDKVFPLAALEVVEITEAMPQETEVKE